MSLKLKPLSVLLTGLCVLSVQADDAPSHPFAGMTGREIIETVRADWRPARPVTSTDDITAVMSAFAALPEGTYRDYFSSQTPSSLSRLRPAAVAPLSWWSENSDVYALVKSDLHNLLPSNPEATSKRSDYPPGVLTTTTYTNGSFKVGIGLISGYETNFYEPADRLKGDFARIYMYMAAAYPQTLWCGRGTMLYADGFYPLLTAYGRSVLLDWHRSDPVDDDELLRNQVIFDSQGNCNPFVSYPDIAEYIWGRNSDQTYPGSVGNPDEPVTPPGPDTPDDPDDPQPEPIMLKAVYSVNGDGRIDFRSPYVAAGSQWTFDGKAVTEGSLTLTAAHVGAHEITYSNSRSHGKVLITVKP